MSGGEIEDDVKIPFPFEFVIGQFTPVSAQSKNSKAKQNWIQAVSRYAEKALNDVQEQYFLDERALAITIYYFPDTLMQGDIDNIVKPILDGMVSVAYPDDKLIERCVVQKFEPGVTHVFPSPSRVLDAAISMEKPCLYIRLEDDTAWRTAS